MSRRWHVANALCWVAFIVCLCLQWWLGALYVYLIGACAPAFMPRSWLS